MKLKNTMNTKNQQELQIQSQNEQIASLTQKNQHLEDKCDSLQHNVRQLTDEEEKNHMIIDGLEQAV